MSNTTDNAPVTPLITEVGTESPVEKKSFVRKGVDYVKSHKKAAIAAVALTGLVGVAAVTGRKTAPSIELNDPTFVYMGELEPVADEDVPVSQEN